MVSLDGVHQGEVHQVEPEEEGEEDSNPLARVDPVALARRMSAAAHRMVKSALATSEHDDDPFDDELGLRPLHNPDGEDDPE